MASNTSSGDLFTNSPMSSKGAGSTGTTEKKKRKRPSKKVPTTVLEASSTDFLDTVQRLTGSNAKVASKDTEKRGKPVTDARKSASPVRYSSQSSYAQHDERQSKHRPNPDSFFQHFFRSNLPFGGPEDETSHGVLPVYHSSQYMCHEDMLPSIQYQIGSHGYPGGSSNSNSTRQYVGSERGHPNDDFSHVSARASHDTSNTYTRALENEISPYSWRDQLPMNHSDLWYQIDQVPAMRA